MKKRILVVDDEPDIVDLISYNLKKEGYEVRSARDGRKALELAETTPAPDLIILDLMMPELDGFEVCRRLKASDRTSPIPIIFLTARSGEYEEILGLEIGADDFIQKPISPRKLLVRIKAVLRRREEPLSANPVIRIGDLRIDRTRYAVHLGEKELSLARKEFEILALLAEEHGRVFSRELLLNRIWGHDVVVGDRTVDVHVRRIREKLGVASAHIETVKGVGYRFRS